MKKIRKYLEETATQPESGKTEEFVETEEEKEENNDSDSDK